MKKFTLIELLVVVAIIGILASILMPSLSKARAKTIQAVCLSNQKQIKMASVLYSDANDEWFVRSANSQNRSWVSALHDANLLVVPNSTESTNGNVYHRQQEGNSFVVWCPAETSHHPIADIGFNNNLSWGVKHSKVSAVISPVEVVHYGDAFRHDRLYGAWHINASGFISQGTGQAAGGSPYPDQKRHLDRAVSIFVDGHGTYLHKSKVLAYKNKLYTGPFDTSNPDYN